jgi:hypothetical protein
MGLGEISGLTGELLVDVHDVELLTSRVEPADRDTKLATRESSEAVGLSQCSPPLGVDESSAHDSVGFVPQLRSLGRARLGDDEMRSGRAVLPGNSR